MNSEPLDGLLDNLELETRIRDFCREFDLQAEDDQTIGNAIDMILTIINREIHLLVNQILHHPKFQRLEATIRSIKWLTEVTGHAENVRIQILDIDRNEFERDLDAGYKKSILYRKIYRERFDRPFGMAVAGDAKAVGYPYGLIVADFEYGFGQSEHYGITDYWSINGIGLRTVMEMSELGRDCFCPFICGVSPSTFNIESFTELEDIQNIPQVFGERSRLSWREFRKRSSAKFVGLVMPRVLIRKPYRGTNHYFVPEPGRKDRLMDKSFFFNEIIDGKTENLLWGNGVFVLAEIAARAFNRHGWFADIRGYEHDEYYECGIVTQFPQVDSATDSPGVAPVFPTEVAISSVDDSVLSEQGFIALHSHKYTGFCGILSCQSVLQPMEKNEDFNLSTMLNYVLCVCRLGLVLKYELTKLIGTTKEVYQVRSELNELAREFCTSSTVPDERREKPLSKVNVEVTDDPDKPGNYMCEFAFEPHFQFHNVNAQMALTTVLRRKD